MVIIQLTVPELQGLFRKEIEDYFSKDANRSTSENKEDQWFNLDEYCEYNPNKPKRSTVYGQVAEQKIPHHKRGKRIYFLKSEIDDWLKAGRKKTTEEIKAEAAQYVKGKGVKNGR